MELSAAENLLLEDFGQKVDLTRRIREILVNYPEGTTILKELIQNADDAGATKVCLCLDRRVHGVDSLLSDRLAQCQGPALLAYNDASFTEDDFVSISRIGGSSKHSQTWKTGRFGIGFNSVYHLTDLPSFVSGKYVVLFDPQGFYLPNVSATNPGKRIEYVSSSAKSMYKDQFFPYCAFGCNMESPFSGTLFRLPLRNLDQSAKSRLSRQAYSEDDISSMFAQLYEEGVFALLFLKNVLCIEMFIWDDGEPEPKKIYSCHVSSPDDDTIAHRQLLLRLSKPSVSKGDMDSFKLDVASEALNGSCVHKKIDSFYVVQTMASGSSRIAAFAATASREYDIHLLPWGSVAVSLSDDLANDEGIKLGRAFCFLPLPVRTGLNVQINGYFEVSSNRRGIWYGEDMDRSGRIRSVWNRLLLEDVIAPAFSHLLLAMQDILGPTELYYSLFPSGDFEEPWNILVEYIYKNLGRVSVLYTDTGEGRWVSPAEAFLLDKFSDSEELSNVLVQLGMPIVRLPGSLCEMLLKHAMGFQQKVVTPYAVRNFIRGCGDVSMLGSSQRLLLLEYCLEDLVDSDIGRHAYGLPLLPLASGKFGSLCEAAKGVSYFLCDELEYNLLQQISDRVINQDIPKNVMNRLLAIAESEGANILVFNVGHLAQLFHEFVPSDWRRKSKVFWHHDNAHATHPTSAWFIVFWQYMQRKCDSLSLFDDWPIIPSTSGHLYRASRQSKLINPKKLSKEIRCILNKIGCKMLDDNYGVEQCDLSHYVSDANAVSVLESIFDVVSSCGGIMLTPLADLEAEERDELRLFLLDSKWYFSGCMVDVHVQKCRRLPIYRVHGGESSQNFQFSDLADHEKYLPPLDVPNCFLGSDFIISSSNVEDEILDAYFGLKRMGKAKFYKKYVFSRLWELCPKERDNIMLSVLKDLPHLCIEDSCFKDVLRNLEFVTTHTGAIKSPSALYDPRNEELLALLEDANLFPCGTFQQTEILDVLQGLGLRTSVSPETIIQSAHCIEQLVQNDPDKAYVRGKVLLSYLEANAHRWLAFHSSDDQGSLNRMLSRAATAFRPRNFNSDLDKFWSSLQVISWCPVLVCAPFEALPWPVVSSRVAPPKLVRMKSDMWLVSASMRILDGDCSSTILSNQLGWSSPLTGSVIAAQLLELGKNNEIVTDQIFRQELALAMPRIYARLTDLISTDEMDIVKAVLEGCRWIWVGDGFAVSDEVVLSGPLHLAPYIRVIPVDLAVFRNLFLDLGVRESLDFTDYANVLCRMAERKRAVPLTSQELTSAILVVQHLAESQFNGKQIKIYLPDTSSCLIPASELVYNDAPWLLGSDDSSSLSDHASSVSLSAKRAFQKFVHGNISNDVAEKLGVCSLRRLLLAESADSMNLGLSGAAEAFGQHEALTTRLKHILDMYADGPGILFELVQNAEDAGASEVTFLLDKTHFGTSSVLSPEMADWQGPALYCYNDSIFSAQDLYAISRIGQESKLDKPFAIGRFGLGFNSVYHFTDIPSFVSGENIVMFDPHAFSLPGISPSHPGLRIRYVGKKILEQFPDQFSPFLYFGCDLQRPFPGTLFRFPLRTASIAPRSQIKKEGYAPEDVLSLFSSFSEVVPQTLLFLRRVKSISLFVKDGPTSDMQLIHRVQRCSSIVSRSNPSDLLHMFKYIHGDQQNDVNEDKFLDKLSTTIDRDLPWRFQKVEVKEQHPPKTKAHTWILSECLGNGRVLNESGFVNNRSYRCIPWATVAGCLSVVEVEKGLGPLDDVSAVEESSAVTPETSLTLACATLCQQNFEGRAFCFLPLPITTGLPVHVNAYFELSSNRRDIWFGNDMSGGGKKRSDWNKYLLDHVAAPAYGHLLEELALEIGPSDLFFSFWPTKTGAEPWSSMLHKLYMFIADSEVRVLYTKARGGRWISTKQALFPDFSFNKMLQLVDALSDAGLPVVSVPLPLVERFTEVRPSLHYLTPGLLRTLLIRRKSGFDARNALMLALEYCLFDLMEPIRPDCLYGLSLIPLASGSYTAFNRRGIDERIYIARADDYGLLKDSVPGQLVDKEVPDDMYKKLCEIAASEESNISYLTCDLLEKLLVRILPVGWQNAKKVTWIPGHDGHPTVEWFRQLWRYLNSDCHDLSVFFRWPILPVGENLLLPLTKNSNIIEDEGWSENLLSLLVKVGCLFLRHDLQIEHPQLKHYVQPPTATGILNAFLALAGKIENIEVLFADASEGELHELRSFILQSKWFHENGMQDIHIQVIKHIPMFESFRNRKLLSLSNGTKWLKPNGMRDDLFDDSFVRAESERERMILNKYLNIHEVSKVDFYKDHVLKHMSEIIELRGAVSAILHDVKLLIEEDVSIKNVLLTTPFVLASNGLWQQPCRLYDPRIPELKTLLHKEVFFPSDKFSDDETLDLLVSFGLKQGLGYGGLLDCARTVSILHDSGDPETVILGRKLFACLDALGLKLSTRERHMAIDTTLCVYSDIPNMDKEYLSSSNGMDHWQINSFLGSLIDDEPDEEFWLELKAISWCPICGSPPLRGLPWLTSSAQVVVPSTVRPKSQMWMVSSNMHLLDADFCSRYLQDKLGWEDLPKADVLSTQLIELLKCYAQLKQDSSVDSTFDVELQKGIILLYSAMQEYIGSDDFRIIKSSLHGMSWIWIGDGFASAKALAFDSPVNFHPYLYVVPADLSVFRDLLLALDVKLSFDVSDYFHVLQRLKNDIKGSPLSSDQLCFVHRVLEAVADCYVDKSPVEVSGAPLLIPDSSGVLMYAGDLVYNDAPWMDSNLSIGRNFVHPSISNDLANRLGLQSLRYMSLVDDKMAKDLCCMDYARIRELLTSYAAKDFLLFDLLELADCCDTKKMHIIFDRREHSRQSLLQHNLGEFQGPALLAIFEGTSLSREEISSLQLLPPWRLRGYTLSYGLGLLTSYSLCDVLSVISGGSYYFFDPRGLALSPPSSHSPTAKVFSLIATLSSLGVQIEHIEMNIFLIILSGTNLMERFHDQFKPMLVGENMAWSFSNSTIIRMPLSMDSMDDGPQDGSEMMKQIYERFVDHGSQVLLSLKSLLQVSLSTWEEGMPQPKEDYSVSVDSSYSIYRNPFPEKKWRKFQISRLFGSSSAATKMHAIDINCCRGESKVVDRWLISLSLGSGQTRNMALDRRYLAYNLTPVAGIAAHISQNGQPNDTHIPSSIMSPLPLSSSICMPVTLLGCFLVRHNKGRYLFKIQEGIEGHFGAENQLIEAWNKELMSCVCDSYIEMVSEIQKLKGPVGSIDQLSCSHAVIHALKACSDRIYSMWPRSHPQSSSNFSVDAHKMMPIQLPRADWECIVECVIKPFYARLVDLPVWQLYSGKLVKVEEGMFLSQPDNGVGDNLLPVTVCNFVKEHYPVFLVPWDLLTEIQEIGIRVREIKPKMVRDLLRVSSTSIVIRSVEAYIDVLEYCLTDIQLPDSSGSGEVDAMINFVNSHPLSYGSSVSIDSIRGLHGISTHGPVSSGGDAVEIMANLGKALFDFGRGVVEDIGKAGGPLVHRSAVSGSGSNDMVHNGQQLLSIAAELKGIPCPTAEKRLAVLGVTELWVGNKEQQMLMLPLQRKFVHLKVIERPFLADILYNYPLQYLLKLQKFSLELLEKHMRLLFHESWVNHVTNSNMAPWFSWENNACFDGEGGPSPEWIRLFWRNFNGSSEELSPFAEWPLIPAFLGRPVLCRLRERQLVFIPPLIRQATTNMSVVELGASETMPRDLSVGHGSLSETVQPYALAYRDAECRYPWLMSLLNHCNIPMYDSAFLECAASCDCLPVSGQSLGQAIASKLVAAKQAGYLPELTSFHSSDCEELFKLFVSDYSTYSSNYCREELDVLCVLPIYKTVVGSYCQLEGQDLCLVASNSFLKPFDEHCLSYTTGSDESLLLRALGVPELHDQQILVRFGLAGFEHKTQPEQEDVLIYIYMNWQDLQGDSSVVEALKETKFVRNADEFSEALSRPVDLFDPDDSLLVSVFSGERKKFPGERFSTDGWLRILRKLGLRSSTEANVILECARRVESLGSEYMKNSGSIDYFDMELAGSPNELSLEIWSLAESVIKAILSNFAVLYSNNFCSTLGDIVCVPAERGFPNVGGRKGGKRVLSSYRDAILLKDWPLAWSSSPILSRSKVIPPEYSWGALQLKSPPAFSAVLRHLQVVGGDGGGDTLAHWPSTSSVMTVEDASCEILKYLDGVWDSLSYSDIEGLRKVAFLPAANGTRLVKANCLFVRLAANLSPFAFELPNRYLPFIRVLKDLGLCESLSIEIAKDLLFNLQKACGYQRLNPNELRAVMEILYFICDGMNETLKSADSVWDMEAVVPDDGCRLVHARSCIYLDSYGSRYVKFLNTSRLRFVHPSIPERICLVSGIKRLSDVVVEELHDEENLQPLEGIRSIQLTFIRQKLLSQSFQEAVCKIVNSVGSSVPSFDIPSSEGIGCLLKDAAAKLQFVQSIHTRFLLLPKSLDITYMAKDSTIPEWPDESRHRALYYVNSARTVILVSEPPSYISVVDLIAIIVSYVLGFPTPLPLGPLFLCPQGTENIVVDLLKLFSERRSSGALGSMNDIIGDELLAQDALQVQFHPLRPFYMGEIIAWRPHNGEKLKYGRIVEDVRPSSGQALYRLKVDIGPGLTETILSSNVFSFRGISMDGGTSSATFSGVSHVVSESKRPSKELELSGRGKGISMQLQRGEDLQYGRVSPAELVQAVHEMLSAAGISMDAGKQELLCTTMTMQEQLKQSQEALLLEQDKADAAAKEADTAKTAWQCRVCLSAEVDVALVPCGHVLCRRCSSAVSRCPFCRLQVSKSMRIFRP